MNSIVFSLNKFGVFFLFSLLVVLSACPRTNFDSCDELNPDLDGDGFCMEDDCNDFEALIYPGAIDETIDGIDQNCDGVDGLDEDGDGHVSSDIGGDDCDDSNPEVYPTVQKINGGFVNGCDGSDSSDVTPLDLKKERTC